MTTIEGNKLIAKFIGENVMVTWKDSSGKGWNSLVNVEDIDKYEKVFLPYDSDWSWLMKVVQKIGEIDSEWLADNRNEFIEPLMCASIFTSIKSVWDYVVLFIQWYNENKIK